MKPTRLSLRRYALAAFSAAIFTHVGMSRALAAAYWWDNNGADEGYGTAGGVWEVPTLGDATQGWSTNSAGTVLPGAVTTTVGDALNFGSSTHPLATGAINVEGTVSGNSILFSAATGAGTITLNGGTISLGGSGSFVRANRA